MTARRILGLAFAAVLLLILLPAVSLSQDKTVPPVSAKIEAELLDLLSVKGSADFIVTMAEQADLSAAYQMRDWQARGQYVYNTLKQGAERSQAQARGMLSKQGLKFQTFIVGNELYIWAGDLTTATDLARLPNVASIRATRTYYLDPILGQDPTPQSNPQAVTDWGITDTRADQFWSTFGSQGDGITVANIDSGVQWDHPALISQFKCPGDPSNPACWADPSNICGGSACDNVGHGSHTMGTMVAGDDSSLPYIAGMAPNARWIACKGCEYDSCSDYALNACADWILAPGGDPANRPHVVNNSWGGYGCETSYLPKVQAWRAAGTFPAFSVGNNYFCNSLGSPGDYQESFGSAAHRSDRVISGFSSKGPSCFGDDPYTKPNISAPGENICSTVPGNGWDCYYSGTSMASPHSAGAVVLLWSCNPALIGQIDQTFEILQDNADTPPPGDCGAPQDGQGNYTYGYGYLNVYQAGLTWCAETGTLEGRVTDAATETSIEGALIEVVHQNGGLLTTLTDDSGAYDLMAMVGLCDVTAFKYGYLPQTVTGVEVLTDTVTTQDFTLAPAPLYTVAGTITDATTGWPLYARINIDGYPHSPVWTNPETGYYRLELVGGVEYTFYVHAWTPGYLTDSRTVGPFTGDRTENFALLGDPGVCNAPGYRLRVAHSQDFEANDGLYLAAGTNSTWEWGAPTSGPGSAHSGANVWATELDGNYLNSEDSFLTSPGINLTSLAGQSFVLSWWQWLQTESIWDFAEVQVSNNGGASWTTVYGPADGNTDLQWAKHEVLLDPSYAVPNFQLRFHLYTDYSVVYPGWYVDDIVISGDCQPQPGGLAVGNVYDENTADSLPGADVSNDSGEATITRSTPEDPAVDDAFCVLFSPAGNHTFTAAKSGYLPDNELVAVAAGDAVRQDFFLPAGRLSFTPPVLEVTLAMGQSTTVPSTLNDDGGAPAVFELQEQDRGFGPTVRFQEGFPYEPSSLTCSDPAEKAPASSLQGHAPLLWGTGSPIPTGPRYRAAGVSCDGQTYYLFGGWDLFDNILGESWKYDPSTDTWTPLAGMPMPLTNLTATCIKGNVFLVGGYDGGSHTNYFQIYDTARNTWTLTTWPNARTPMTAAWNNKLYAFGGNPAPSNETWVYDPASGSWDGPLASMPTAAAYGAAVSVRDDIYVIGGSDGGGALSSVQRYDPARDAWDTSGPSLQDPRMSALAVWYGPYLYVISGGGAAGDFWSGWDTTEVYDISRWPAGSWTYDDETVPTPAVAMAGACAQNALWGAGGTSGGYTYDVNQYLDDGLGCNDLLADVPWLSESPITGTVPANTDQPIDVTFDASVPQVTQPGKYYARIQVENDTPYGPLQIPVTMTVVAPPWYGKLNGTVTGLGYCNTKPAPLEEARLLVEGSTGLTWTLETGAGGYYQLWLDEASSPLTITVTDPEHEMGQATGVVIVGQMTTTVDVDLRWLEPCVSVTPAGLSASLEPGDIETQRLTLSNTGAAPADFQIRESRQRAERLPSTAGRAYTVPEAKESKPGGKSVAPLAQGGPDPFGYTYRDSREPGGPQYEWIDIAPPAGGSGLPLDMTGMDDGYYWPIDLPWTFNFYGIDHSQLAVASNGILYFENAYLGYVNLPMPGNSGYDVNTFIAHWWDDMHVSPGDVYYLIEDDRIIIEYYQNSGCCVSPDHATWEVILFENGSILMQYQDTALGDWRDHGASATVGIQGDTIVGLQYSYESASLWDNLAICFAYPGTPPDCGPANVPWLSESPVSGTILADSAQPVDITFDVAAVAQPGEYHAILNVMSEDPVNDRIGVPITLTVILPPDWGKLEGTVTSLGYCDTNPVPLEKARVLVEGSTGLTWTLETNAEGYYQLWMDEANSPLNITVTDPEHEMGQATGVVIVGQMTTTVDIDLRWLRPCVSISPTSLEVTVLRDTSETYPIALDNSGAVSTPFSIQEREGTVWPPEAGIATGKGEWLYRAEQGVEMRSNRGETELAYPSAYRWQPDRRTSAGNILVYADDFIHTAPNTYVDQALRALGLPYTAHYGGDFGGFASDLSGGGPWDLVIFENAGYHSYGTSFPEMLAYVQSGGKLAAEIWTMLWDNTDPLYAELGVTYVTNDVSAPPVYWWDPVHPIFTIPESAPPWLNRSCSASWSCGQYLDPVAGVSGALAGYTMDPTAGSGSFILRNDGQTVYKGFADTTTDADADGDGILDGVELWINLIDGIQYGFAEDALWLKEEPTTGTVDADSTFPLEITFTAFPTMPAGTYTATLLIRTEDPVNRTFDVPVTMTVVHAPICSFENSSPDEMGETTFFTNTTDEGLSPTTYQWDFGDGSPVSNAEHPEHNYAHVGLYNVVLTATNQWGEGVCSDTISIKGVEASFVSNSPVILGRTVIFTNTTLSNPPVVQWFWTFGDSYSSEEENPVHTFAETGIYTVTLFAANLPYQIQGSVYDIYQDTVKVGLAFHIYLPIVVRDY